MQHALRTLFRSIVSGTRNGGSVPTHRRRPGRMFGMNVEALEDRALLSAATPFISTTDAPGNHEIPANETGVDGVVSITVNGNLLCSGSLLASGRHVLTAAHCLKGTFETENGEQSFEATPENVVVTFNLAGGSVSLGATRLFVHADWTNDILAGSDVAIIELDEFAPIEADRYDILRVPLGADADALDVGQYELTFGYGLQGTGDAGSAGGTYGTLRHGWNQFDTANLAVNPFDDHGGILYFDFDNGIAANDALGEIEGLHDLGLGDAEAATAPGDSGGPVFVNGLIAGITSGGYGDNPDVADLFDGIDTLPGVNSSFGEIGASTRVSSFAHWIDDTVGDVIDNGDAGFSAPGFQSSGLAGYQGDSVFAYGGTATYSFTGLEPGWYDVSAIAPGESTYTTNNAKYSIDNGVSTIHVSVDQRPGLNNWTSLDYVQVPQGASTLTVIVSQGTGGSGAIRADAIRVMPVTPLTVIDDGDAGFSAPGWQPSGLTAYQGDSDYGYSGAATYTFSNVTPGWYRISANTPGHSGSSNNATYTFTSGSNTQLLNIDQRPGTNGWSMLDYFEVPAGAGTLTVRLTQGGGGSGALRADAMKIERVDAPVGITIDDGDAVGFSASSNWTTSGLKGYAGDSRYGYSGAATYDFSGLADGNYRVLAQWPGHQYSSSNAAYQITSGTSVVGTSVDQRTGTQGWRELANITVEDGIGSIQVVVSQGSGGSGAIRADAIRVEPTDTFFDRYERDLLANLAPLQQGAGGGQSGWNLNGGGANSYSVAQTNAPAIEPAVSEIDGTPWASYVFVTSDLPASDPFDTETSTRPATLSPVAVPTRVSTRLDVDTVGGDDDRDDDVREIGDEGRFDIVRELTDELDAFYSQVGEEFDT